MLVKFHARGKGRGEGPVEYLIGKDGKRDLSKVLRGNPQDTIDLINSSKYEQRYKSGVLSFAEGDDLTDKQKIEIMTSFEEMLLPGLDADQYSCFWVEHRDKGRLELNFVIPCLELRSGKRLQPYYDPVDRRRVNAWAQVKRIELNLADPNEPERKQLLNISKDLPKKRKKIPESITAGLLVLIKQGDIKNRADIVNKLNENGLRVVRETKSSISIADIDGGQNIRLKGWIYERDVRFSAGVRAEIKARSADYRASHRERLEQARAELARAVEIKKSEFIKRYSAKRFRTTKNDQTEQLEVINDGIQSIDIRSDSGDVSNSDNSCINLVFDDDARKLRFRDKATKGSDSGEQQAHKREDSAIQRSSGSSGIQEDIQRRGISGDIRRSEIHQNFRADSENRYRIQRDEESFFQGRAEIREKGNQEDYRTEEEIDDRNRAITIRQLAEDRNQTARIIEQIFRRFDARIQGLKQSLLSSFKQLSAAITTRVTSARSLIVRSEELRQKNRELAERDKQFGKFNEQRHEYLKYRSREVSDFNEKLSAANKSIIRISQSIAYIEELAQEQAKQDHLKAQQAAKEAALAAEKARRVEEARLKQLDVQRFQYVREFEYLANSFSWDYRNNTQKWNALNPQLKSFLASYFEISYQDRDKFLLKNFEQINPSFVEQLNQKHKTNENSRGRGR